MLEHVLGKGGMKQEGKKKNYLNPALARSFELFEEWRGLGVQWALEVVEERSERTN